MSVARQPMAPLFDENNSDKNDGSGGKILPIQPVAPGRRTDAMYNRTAGCQIYGFANRPYPRRYVRLQTILGGCLFAIFFFNTAAGDELSSNAYRLLSERAQENFTTFYVYQTMDAGYNHGFPSQLFGTALPSINAACVDDPDAYFGCSSNINNLDKTGTRFQLDFSTVSSQGSNAYGGLNFVEPQDYQQNVPSNGYNLEGSTVLLFSARSPTGVTVRFGVGGATTQYVTFPKSETEYTSVCIELQSGGALSSCPESSDVLTLSGSIDLSDVHILFGVETSYQQSPGGGAILFRDIRYEPFPASQLTVPSLPLSTQTFGVVPATNILRGRVAIPPDQVNRNIAALYESSIMELALFARGNADNLKYAYEIADSLVYALSHENHGDPLPPPKGGGLHNAYEAGDLALLNSQGETGGQAGQVRLAGFSASTALCGTTGYCLVLDGATGGDDAFAVLALLKAYSNSGNATYLDAADRIGNWIYGQLRDRTGTGYGGYFVGYPDEGAKKILETGKSTENNADIFAAFSALAGAESGHGQVSAAKQWTARAKFAGDFVINMFDRSSGCFNAGTVPVGTPPGLGIDPMGRRRGNDVINIFPFFDSNSFTYLALADSTQYHNAIKWSRIVKCLKHFQQTVEAGGKTYDGYDIVEVPQCVVPRSVCGPNGIAWEFTGQAAVIEKLSGGDASHIISELRRAQAGAPFGDGKGLVASTMQDGDRLAPYEQCLSTPFQCIPERVGLAATTWAIFAENGYNPL